MKKTTLLLCATLFLAACTPPEEIPPETEPVTEAVTEAQTETWVPEEYAEALERGQSYLSNTPMSRTRLFHQLTSTHGEGLSDRAAMYALEHIDTDWQENTVKASQSIRDLFDITGDELFEELTHGAERMTDEEAIYAMEQIGEYPWAD